MTRLPTQNQPDWTPPHCPSAFPWVAAGFMDTGMELRDWFAGQCDVSVYCPLASFVTSRGKEPTIDELAEYIAQIRLIEADALIAARTQEKG